MSSQAPLSDEWRRDRLRHLTNFGFLGEGSDLLAVELDTWYYLPYDEVGEMRWQARLPVVLNGHVAVSLQRLLARTSVAFQGLMRPSVCNLSFGVYPRSIQVFGVEVPIPTSEAANEVLQTIAAYGLEGHAVSSILLRLDPLITCRDYAGRMGEHWMPQSARIFIQPVTENLPRTGWETEAVPWQAQVQCGCASIFRRDNREVLSRTRGFWHEIRQADPDVTMFPDEADDYDYIFTSAEPPTNEATANIELWSINFPRLEAAIKKWERLTLGAFQWQL